jgi:hypothetical protein
MQDTGRPSTELGTGRTQLAVKKKNAESRGKELFPLKRENGEGAKKTCPRGTFRITGKRAERLVFLQNVSVYRSVGVSG